MKRLLVRVVGAGFVGAILGSLFGMAAGVVSPDLVALVRFPERVADHVGVGAVTGATAGGLLGMVAMAAFSSGGGRRTR